MYRGRQIDLTGIKLTYTHAQLIFIQNQSVHLVFPLYVEQM